MPTENPTKPITLHDADGKSLAVLSLTAKAIVDGPMCRTTAEVTFHNDLDKVVEGDLVLPLPSFAALVGLTVKVGARQIDGKFKPRDRAQVDYDRAKQAGNTAALAETEGEDLARLRVSPIDRGEDVVVTLTLVHPLTAAADGHRLIVPLTYMPRFEETGSTLKSTEQAANDRPRPLTLAARASVEIFVVGLPKLRCATHAATISPTEVPSAGQVVKVDDVALDHDLILEVVDRPAGSDPIAWVRHDPTDGPDMLGPTTAVAVIPPSFADEGQTTPRDVIFVLDHSGSMGGPVMEAAKTATRACLRALNAQDLFNVVAFDDSVTMLADASMAFNEQNLKAADEFIDKVHADGGTELSKALQAVLAGGAAEHVEVQNVPRASMAHRLRIVIVLTDGDVGSAEHTLKQISDKLHDTRVFVLGIGCGVRHDHLAKLAETGRGTYSPTGLEVADIDKAVKGLKSAIDAPVLTGVKVRISEDGNVRDADKVESLGALDLFAAQPLLLAFRGALHPSTTLILSGQRASGEDFRLQVKVSTAGNAVTHSGDAAMLWAMLRNQRMTYRFDPKDDAALEELGVAFGITNRKVALVGVHEDQRGLANPDTVPVVLPLPRNLASLDSSSGSGTLGGVTRSMMPMSFSAGGSRGVAMGGATSKGWRGGTAKGMSLSASVQSRSVPGVYQSSNLESTSLCSTADDDLSRGIGDLNRERGDSAPIACAAASWMDSEPSRGAGPSDDDVARDLMLRQGADGLFDKSVEATLSAVAALVVRGHTLRTGSYRAELRRTATALAAKLPGLTGNEQVWALFALALLRGVDGGTLPAGLPSDLAAKLQGLSTADLPALRTRVRAALADLASRTGLSLIGA